ncbi:MAG: D-alanine--D-alanine ligase [Chlamydiae bacterium]|nr:D-alanine--D-alanine ligase [Chlamydiota bacterium]MBI3267007.1 D-alanine--D-alanine ligase [Chlamydiota bacterium]
MENKKEKIRVAVLMGGSSREREISLKSGQAVSRALKAKGFDVCEILEMEDLSTRLLNANIDVAFIALHGRFGEDGQVQKILESVHIPYTGCGPEASFLALHKNLSKKVFDRSGISTPAWVSGSFENLNSLESQILKLEFPLVLKPVDEGSSIGLEIVQDLGHLPQAFERIRQVTQEILVEKFIQGDELTVGILNEVVLPIIRIKTDRSFYDFEAKYSTGHTEYEVPAQIPSAIFKKVQDLALKAHRALGCRDLSRVDILLDLENQPWVLEINTIPGFTEKSLLPKAAQAVGLSFEDLCEKILEMALTRIHNRVHNHASSKALRL